MSVEASIAVCMDKKIHGDIQIIIFKFLVLGKQ